MNRSPILVVFAKAPRPGLVKTRMCPPLSPEQAADLYSHMLDDVLEASAAFAVSLGLVVWVAVHPQEAVGEIAARARAGQRVVAQRGRDLSGRMAWASAEASASGASRVLLRGSDSPAMSEAIVASALERLEDHDLVVSPDRDGGYSLIGTCRAQPGLFDHPMSTSSVMHDTLERARALGLRSHRLAASFDLDCVDDLVQLEALRGTPDALLCPRTLRYASELPLLLNSGGPGARRPANNA